MDISYDGIDMSLVVNISIDISFISLPIQTPTMYDEIIIFFFGKFYFYDTSLLVNYTSCIKICHAREMNLPKSNENSLILHQLFDDFGADIFSSSNGTEQRTNQQNYLTFFIGKPFSEGIQFQLKY